MALLQGSRSLLRRVRLFVVKLDLFLSLSRDLLFCLILLRGIIVKALGNLAQHLRLLFQLGVVLRPHVVFLLLA